MMKYYMVNTVLLIVAIMLNSSGVRAAELIEQKKHASSIQNYAEFGYSVDIDGDTAVVGAPAEDIDDGWSFDIVDAGAAYVLKRQANGTWIEQAKLTTPNIMAQFYVGDDVAISGDTIVVGAPGRTYGGIGGIGNPNEYVGFYVFARSGTAWNYVAKLLPTDPFAHVNFGNIVDIDGGTIVGGAPLEDSKGTVYVFASQANGSWTQQTKLTASDAQEDDYFGCSVAIDGNIAVVGAYGEDGGAGNPVTDSGTVYVFERSGVNWQQVAKLRASDAQSYDWFGAQVAIDGNTIVVGAYYESGGSGDPVDSAGAAYIFTRTGGSWQQTAKLMASDAQAWDNFGRSIAIDGEKVFIGSYYEDGGSGSPLPEAGAVYAFTGSGSSWSQITKITASDAQADDYFGHSIAVSDDYTIIGSPYEDGGNGDPHPDIGGVYFYGPEKSSSSLVPSVLFPLLLN
ncbi:hypothetical protein GMJAKD_01855 [Candidatus Electrothrix aarhusensis]